MAKTSLNTSLPHQKRKRLRSSSPQTESPTPIETPCSPSQTRIKTTKTPNPSSSQSIEPMLSPHPLKPKRKKQRKEGTEECSTQGERWTALTLKSGTLTRGFALNLDWCHSCKYSELIDILQFQGWIKLFNVHSKKPLIPDAMHEFIKNFKCVDGECTSTVNGTSLKFNADYLSKIFEVPNFGYSDYFKYKHTIQIGNVGHVDIMRFVGGVVCDAKTTVIRQSSFSALVKLLFNIVRKGVVPRPHKRYHAGLLDCALIYCLGKKVQINFSSLMIKHLNHCIPKYTVGYGTLLTTLFESFHVDLSIYDSLGLHAQNILQHHSLSSLGLTVVNGCTSFTPKQIGNVKNKNTVDDEESEGGSQSESDEGNDKESKEDSDRESAEDGEGGSKEENSENNDESEPPTKSKKQSVSKIVKQRGVTRRRSMRVASLTPKIKKPPVYVEVSEEEDEPIVQTEEEESDQSDHERDRLDVIHIPNSSLPSLEPIKHTASFSLPSLEPKKNTISFGGSGSGFAPSFGTPTTFGVPSSFGPSNSGTVETPSPTLEKTVTEMHTMMTSMMEDQKKMSREILSLRLTVGTLKGSVTKLQMLNKAYMKRVTQAQDTVLRRLEEVAFEEVTEEAT